MTIHRTDGKPMAGVKVMPRLVRDLNCEIAEIPASLAAQLGAIKGPRRHSDVYIPGCS